MNEYSFVVVCEAAADRETGTQIADRVLQRGVDWLRGLDLDGVRRWRGLSSSDELLPWKSIPDLAQRCGLRAHGHFAGEPGDADAQAARRALLVLKKSAEPHDGIVLLRDSDGDPGRRRGLEQAVNEARPAVPVVLGVAECKREAWILNGFAPSNDQERSRLETARRELGFDPVLKAERLDAREHGAKRDAKRVMSDLCCGDADREAACWRDTDLDTLESRGAGSGLATFMSDVDAKLSPLFVHRAVPPPSRRDHSAE